jgi:hypothetical protein
MLLLTQVNANNRHTKIIILDNNKQLRDAYHMKYNLYRESAREREWVRDKKKRKCF